MKKKKKIKKIKKNKSTKLQKKQTHVQKSNLADEKIVIKK